MQEQTARQALIVLPGLTADGQKLEFLSRFFSAHSPYAVYVPHIPKRRGLRACAHWLDRYINGVVEPGRFEAVQILAYISGGVVLRQMWATRPIERLTRIVYVRSPIQELTLQTLRQRYGRLLLWVLRGQLMLDVAAVDLHRLCYPPATSGQGLIIETGVSQLARSLGVDPALVSAGSWDSDTLLPGADDVLRVPESHDEVYTSAGVLGAALDFFTQGRFDSSKNHATNG